MHPVYLIIIFVLFGISTVSNEAFSAPEVLSLQQYLDQVKLQSKGILAANADIENYELRARDAWLLTSPYAFGEWSHAIDKRPTQNPLFMGYRTDSTAWTLGVKKLSEWGTATQLAYRSYGFSTQGATYLPLSDAFQNALTLEITQPLWRNWLGGETQANQTLIHKQNRAESEMQHYQSELIFSKAEAAYWRLAIARENVRSLKAILSVSEDIRSWADRRARLGLGDRTDFLQADASVALRRLDLRSALSEEVSATREWNQWRGVDSDQADETLESFSARADQIAKQFSSQEKAIPKRRDLLVAEVMEQVEIAKNQMGVEQRKPNLEVFGTAGLHGLSEGFGDAAGDSISTKYPMYSVGLRFNVPLDVKTVLDSKSGFQKGLAAAELRLAEKRFSHDTEWKDMEHRLSEAVERLVLAQKLESVQKTKLFHEKTRLSQGRSTTYQVLVFSQDFAQAELNRIRIEGEILYLANQRKQFKS